MRYRNQLDDLPFLFEPISTSSQASSPTFDYYSPSYSPRTSWTLPSEPIPEPKKQSFQHTLTPPEKAYLDSLETKASAKMTAHSYSTDNYEFSRPASAASSKPAQDYYRNNLAKSSLQQPRRFQSSLRSGLRVHFEEPYASSSTASSTSSYNPNYYLKHLQPLPSPPEPKPRRAWGYYQHDTASRPAIVNLQSRQPGEQAPTNIIEHRIVRAGSPERVDPLPTYPNGPSTSNSSTSSLSSETTSLAYYPESIHSLSSYTTDTSGSTSPSSSLGTPTGSVHHDPYPSILTQENYTYHYPLHEPEPEPYSSSYTSTGSPSDKYPTDIPQYPSLSSSASSTLSSTLAAASNLSPGYPDLFPSENNVSSFLHGDNYQNTLLQYHRLSSSESLREEFIKDIVRRTNRTVDAINRMIYPSSTTGVEHRCEEVHPKMLSIGTYPVDFEAGKTIGRLWMLGVDGLRRVLKEYDLHRGKGEAKEMLWNRLMDYLGAVGAKVEERRNGDSEESSGESSGEFLESPGTAEWSKLGDMRARYPSW
ncbi:hypothetical protein BJ508DRAFT_302841 [Ascobolus immersus RN42]|uniref:Uncharacterized protein n=1 Tax=Ascobolus immersus RN42 TaxID=1160509 RepID=A0A3N4IIX1_ASCIM|nr:hypothetical protein BJ508DRAFT_302841 [Ascobolus immersus RN42]